MDGFLGLGCFSQAKVWFPAPALGFPALELTFLAVELRLPALGMRLPPVEVRFRAVEMRLPALEMACPAVETRIPAVEMGTPVSPAGFSLLEIPVPLPETALGNAGIEFPGAFAPAKARVETAGNRLLMGGIRAGSARKRQTTLPLHFCYKNTFCLSGAGPLSNPLANSNYALENPGTPLGRPSGADPEATKQIGLTNHQLLERFTVALKEETGVVQSNGAVKMRLDRVFYSRMRRNTTRVALARALDWTLLEFEKAIAQKNNGSRKRRRRGQAQRGEF
jgi:hypothetical protein